jgi:hypothetical protein
MPLPAECVLSVSFAVEGTSFPKIYGEALITTSVVSNIATLPADQEPSYITLLVIQGTTGTV